jgi:hypothetical protein
VTLLELWSYVRDAGTLGVLVLIIVGGWKRYYVWGWYADEQSKRIAELESRLERATRVAESGTAAADRATRVAERRAGGSDELR